jgi:signal transduction histidine kinase
MEFIAGELRLALEEIARLKTALAETDRNLMSTSNLPGSSPDHQEQSSAITTITEDLRQPVRSIANNIGFLLSNSVGNLDPLQHKFLERIMVSTERVNRLIDDLVQVTTFEGRGRERSSERVSLTKVVDTAVAQTEEQRREKNLKLHVNLPDPLPLLHTNSSLLVQVIDRLLRNAAAVTPPDGMVSLSVLVKSGDEDWEYVLIQVSDQGMGEESEGLSTIKTTIEALGGRTWIDSEPGAGSVFSILLPTPASGFRPEETGGLSA